MLWVAWFGVARPSRAQTDVNRMGTPDWAFDGYVLGRGLHRTVRSWRLEAVKKTCSPMRPITPSENSAASATSYKESGLTFGIGTGDALRDLLRGGL